MKRMEEINKEKSMLTNKCHSLRWGRQWCISWDWPQYNPPRHANSSRWLGCCWCASTMLWFDDFLPTWRTCSHWDVQDPEPLSAWHRTLRRPLTGGLNTEALNNAIGVLFLWFAELKLTHNRICVGNSNDGIMANRHHLSVHLALQIGTLNMGGLNLDRGGSNNNVLYRLMLLLCNLKRLRTLRKWNHIRTPQRTIKWKHI